jgi:Raf kinase inhibitor-like YbhB/YbcL family protein
VNVLEKLPEAIGHALEHQRAGMEKILFNLDRPGPALGLIEVTSPAFARDSQLPQRYTADGAGLSPPLRWRHVPVNTGTLALIVEDADSPTPEPLVHGIVVEIDPQEVGLVEGIYSRPPHSSPEKLGLNSYLTQGWLPPDPPPGHGVHRYVFQVFALAAGQSLSQSPGRAEVAAAVRERALAKGCLIGTYQREVPVRSIAATESVLADETPVIGPAETARTVNREIPDPF